MSIILKTVKFHFSNIYKWQFVSASGVLLLNLLISLTIVKLMQEEGQSGNLDMIVMVWMLILGLVIFAVSFRYLLSFGITRRKVFWAMCTSIASLAAAFTLLTTIFYAVSTRVTNIVMFYELLYKNQDILMSSIWEFAALLLLGMLGWCIRMAYYVSGLKTKVFVSLLPFIAAPLLVFLNILVDGAVARGFGKFMAAAMGFAGNSPNPLIGAASMAAAAVLLGIPVFLMLQRAQVKD